jgi:ubiquinone/menaquinone biosynthesis C-methylase UbiE
MLGEQNNKQIIDIGCGNGELTNDFIYTNQITFLDISVNMLALAKRSIDADYLKNAKFINSDIANYKSDVKFDIAICVGVLAHLESISAVLMKLEEITASNGIIILQYTAAEKMISILNRVKYKLFGRNKYRYNVNLTNSNEIRELIHLYGLDIIKEVSHIPVSPFLSLFNSSVKQKLLQLSYKNKLFSHFGSESILYLTKIPKA